MLTKLTIERIIRVLFFVIIPVSLATAILDSGVDARVDAFRDSSARPGLTGIPRSTEREWRRGRAYTSVVGGGVYLVQISLGGPSSETRSPCRDHVPECRF